MGEPLAAALVPRPAAIHIRSAAARPGRRHAVDSPAAAFWDSEGNPSEEEWRMNGSVMHEPPQPDPPPRPARARATLISMTPWAEPLVGPSFLGLHGAAAGSGASSPMSLAGAFRDILTREPVAATLITDGSDRGLEEAGR